MQREERCVRGRARVRSIEHGAPEGLGRGGIGNAGAHGRIAKGGERGELAIPPLAHRGCEFGPEVAEEREGFRCAPFLAHEEHWNARRQQQDRQWLRAVPPGLRDEPVARRMRDCRSGRGSGGNATKAVGGSALLGSSAQRTAAVARGLALVGEARGEGTAEVAQRVVGVVLVVAGVLAGQEDVQRVVEIVVPLRRVGLRRAADVARETMGLVVVVLEHEVDGRSPAKRS